MTDVAQAEEVGFLPAGPSACGSPGADPAGEPSIRGGVNSTTTPDAGPSPAPSGPGRRQEREHPVVCTGCRRHSTWAASGLCDDCARPVMAELVEPLRDLTAEFKVRPPVSGHAARIHNRLYLQALARRAGVTPGAAIVVMGDGTLARFRDGVDPEQAAVRITAVEPIT